MSTTLRTTVVAGGGAAGGGAATGRGGLLKGGRGENRLDQIGKRLKLVYEFAIVQKKMNYYPLAGIAHKLIFVGFVVLLLRSLILWGRGFDPAFNFWIFGDSPVKLPIVGAVGLGSVYEFLKDISAILVLLGVAVFFYYRVVRHEKRMSLHFEGLVILGIIGAMMVADMVYDGASIALHHGIASYRCEAAASDMADACDKARVVLAHFSEPTAAGDVHFSALAPGGSLFALLFSGMGIRELVFLAHAGFWTHSTLVLIFL